MRVRRPLVLLCAIALLVLTACGGGGSGGRGEQPRAPELGRSEVNPVDPEQLRDGGTFRWPIAELPPNFNRQHVDGALGDTDDVLDALMPSPFVIQADGTPVVNENYMQAVELASTEPQVVTYTIDPDATWSNGRPVTWEDFRAQWQARNGGDPAYEVSSTNGYEDIAGVEPGTDDRQVVVTFARNYTDWPRLFSPLFPLELNADPAVFNDGWTERPMITAGPFRVESVDRTAQRITLVRDEAWWGPPARLDRIVYLVIALDAQPNAYANGALDFFPISGSVAAYARAGELPDTELRTSVAPDMRHITFNGAEGAILADRELRIAIQKAIDRQAIADAMLGRLVAAPEPLGNHIYRAGLRAYRANDQVVAHDPAAAERMLDELGWVRTGDGIRARDGQPLVIRDVIPTGFEVSVQEAAIVREQLRRIGVDVQIDAVPLADFFEQHVNVGDFDITHFAWLGSAFPVSSTSSIYTLQPEVQQNYGRIGNETINGLYAEAIAELDEQRRTELVHRIDTEIWASGHSLLLYQLPDIVAVRSDVANFGAFGFADIVYTDIGFVEP